MSLFKANVPPSRVPTLTEVVEVNAALTEVPTARSSEAPELAAATSGYTAAAPIPVAAPTTVNADVLTQQVMTNVQRQVDTMLEVRLKEALAPIIARLTDSLVRDARSELAKAMKEVVSRAVADEVRRSLSKR